MNKPTKPKRVASILLELLNSDLVFRDVRIASAPPDQPDNSGEFIAIRTPEGWKNLKVKVTSAEFESLLKGMLATPSEGPRDIFKDAGQKAIEKSVWLNPDPAGRDPETWKSQRLRASVVGCDSGERRVMVLRRFSDAPKSLEAQGLPLQVEQMLNKTSGMVLVVGPTGTGKTTTLAAMVSQINHNSTKHIVIIEDPIEYTFEPDKSLITAREVGTDVVSFAAGVREALRMAPDVIVVGEIRDKETLEAATRASESGHLVLATMHAPSSGQALKKVMALFDGDLTAANSFASNLVGVIAQRLLPGLDSLDMDVGEGLGEFLESTNGTTQIKKYVLAYEVVMSGPALVKLMSEDSGLNNFDNLLRDGRLDAGSLSMFEVMKRLVSQKRIDAGLAASFAITKEEANSLLVAG
jgi:Tfp pilus assembly pilus retraction ATPase PilT